MRATMLLALAGAAAAQTAERTWLYEDVTGRGDYRCTRVYDVPAAVALKEWRSLVGEEGPGWTYDFTGPTPVRIGAPGGFEAFLRARYSSSPPPTEADPDGPCRPEPGWNIAWTCGFQVYCQLGCSPSGPTLSIRCLSTGCSPFCLPAGGTLTSVKWSSPPCGCSQSICTASGSVQSFTLASAPYCRCGLLPGPTNPSAVLGPGNNKWSIPVACFEPRIGRDVEVIFVDPVNRYQGNYVLLIGAAPCTVPPVVVEPPGVCSTSFLYVVPASVAVTTMNPAYFTFPVPAEPFLVGFQFCVQGASGRTDGCIVATDGVRVTIQP